MTMTSTDDELLAASLADRARASDLAPWRATLRQAGVESDFGLHLEVIDDPASTPPAPRPPIPYPCRSGAGGTVYTGCIGDACPLQTCWTGGPVPRLQRAVKEARVAARGAYYEPRAICWTCPHACAQSDGQVGCARGHWLRPITPKSFVWRRIPFVDDTADPADCPDYQVAALHPLVLTFRRQRAAVERARHRLRRAR